jgi:predicted DNA-binding transcriptional regulator AlpA
MAFAEFLDPPPKGPVTELAAQVADRVAELLRADIVASDDLIFDTKAAARICGLSPRTLEQMRSTGQGPACIMLTGTSVGYRLGGLREWLRSRPHYGRRALASALVVGRSEAHAG